MKNSQDIYSAVYASAVASMLRNTGFVMTDLEDRAYITETARALAREAMENFQQVFPQ